jgi:hypothetical protein
MSILLGGMQRYHFLFVVHRCLADLVLVLALRFLQEHVFQILFLRVVIQARDVVTSQGFVRRVLRLLQLQQSRLLRHARLIIC